MKVKLNGLFAYGSLINSKSRQLSLPTNKAFPAEIFGERRGWYASIPDARATALGLKQDADSSCNGVLIHLPEEQLIRTDEREIPFGYERVDIPRDRISLGYDGVFPDGPIWIYRCQRSVLPTSDLPIIQSYIDSVLDGCFSISQAFAEKFVNTTEGWNGLWINDRNAPRYLRAYRDAVNERAVDKLLARLQAAAFSKRINAE